MADSKRQQIVNAIDTRLKTILIANGYETNLGQKVYEWRAAPVNENEMPCIIYRDENETIDITIGKHVHTLSISVDIIAAKAQNAAAMRKYIADIVKCIGADLTWGSLAEDTSPAGSDDIQIHHQENIISGAGMKFIVQFTTNPFDPYI